MSLENIPFSVVLAAGGVGSRMGAEIPKQYLPIYEKSLALYSFELFLSLSEVKEIVVVCEECYQILFTSQAHEKKVSFALPGQRRQDSVFNGINALTCQDDSLVCIHDAARPCIDAGLVRRIVKVAAEGGAAVAGVPVKGTIKVCNAEQMILSTLERSSLWEMQTPQVIRLDILKAAYNKILQSGGTVTDDVSLVELLGLPVQVVFGSYKNIKVTTPEDLIFVRGVLKDDVLL
jgi:2-C-methyl-D-erythritol 4-phosphate cytidylyltransferase